MGSTMAFAGETATAALRDHAAKADIEKAIRQPIAITIPNASADLVRAMNSGTPVLPERKSEFAIQMKKWAASLTTGEDAPELVEKRRFAFWS